jgi:hypothetical protein
MWMGFPVEEAGNHTHFILHFLENREIGNCAVTKYSNRGHMGPKH